MLEYISLWNILIGALVGFSFVLSALLYTWAKDEIKVSKNYLRWALMAVYFVTFAALAILENWLYLSLLIVVVLIAVIIHKIKFRIRNSAQWQAWLLGPVLAIGLHFQKELVSIAVLVQVILLGSLSCAGLSSKNAFKLTGKLCLNFLVGFLIVSLIPIVGWLKPALFALCSCLLVAAFSASEKSF